MASESERKVVLSFDVDKMFKTVLAFFAAIGFDGYVGIKDGTVTFLILAISHEQIGIARIPSRFFSEVNLSEIDGYIAFPFLETDSILPKSKSGKKKSRISLLRDGEKYAVSITTDDVIREIKIDIAKNYYDSKMILDYEKELRRLIKTRVMIDPRVFSQKVADINVVRNKIEFRLVDGNSRFNIKPSKIDLEDFNFTFNNEKGVCLVKAKNNVDEIYTMLRADYVSNVLPISDYASAFRLYFGSYSPMEIEAVFDSAISNVASISDESQSGEKISVLHFIAPTTDNDDDDFDVGGEIIEDEKENDDQP